MRTSRTPRPTRRTAPSSASSNGAAPIVERVEPRRLFATFSPTSNAGALLATLIGGHGVTVISDSIKLSGASGSAGTFTSAGNALPFNSGIVFSSGRIVDLDGPNNATGTSTEFDTAGDADLDALIGTDDTHDAVYLEFDFIPTFETVRFQFVFGSEEYNEFVDSAFNDVFGFFLNGENIAVIPGTDTPISINNVNNGDNAQYFTDNEDGDVDLELDGLVGVSIPLFAVGTVTPGVVNTIKLAIADAGDSALDSAVFFKANSFTSGGSVSGTKFEDVNANGVRDAGEPGIAGVTIFVDKNNNSILDANEVSTTTDKDGKYTIRLKDGTYTIREIVPAGWRQTRGVGGYTVTISALNSDHASLDFGNFELASISGYKFLDRDADGVQDFGENFSAGWTIFADANNNGQIDDGEASDVTDSNGYYELGGLFKGTYTVREVIPEGDWTMTTPPHVVSITTSGQLVANRNIGNRLWVPVTVLGTAESDAIRVNGNGMDVEVYINDVRQHVASNITQLFIDAGGGNDYVIVTSTITMRVLITGSGGDDTIVGGSGNDELSGASGKDRVFGGKGDDYILGGRHNDYLSGDGGDDEISGGGGKDRLYGAAGNNRLRGGAQDDVLFSDNGARDTVSGHAGYDILVDPDDQDLEVMAGIEEILRT